MPAGYVTEEGVDYLVRVGDKPKDIEELKKMPLMDLHMEDVPVITLGDVADVPGLHGIRLIFWRIAQEVHHLVHRGSGGE